MNKIEKYSRMLVGLDLTEMDQHIVSYTSMIAKVFKINAVYFLHVTSSLELPQEIADKYGDIMAPIDEALEKEMEETVQKYFIKIPDCNVEVEAHAGDVTEEVLKWIKVKSGFDRTWKKK